MSKGALQPCPPDGPSQGGALFLLQNAASLGPFVVDGAGVPFPWDSPPIINDAGDVTKVSPTEVRFERPGRYEVRYSIYGNTQPADPPAYFAGFADLDGLFLDPSVSQWEVLPNAAVTTMMEWVLPSVNAGQLLRVLLLAFPNVNWFAGAGAFLNIERLR